MIYSADNFEDFISLEQEAQKQASLQIQPWQREVKPGDFIVRKSQGFDIFCEVLPTDPEETMSDYRLVKAFSEVCPQGEMGDIHISTIHLVINQLLFEAAIKRFQKT